MKDVLIRVQHGAHPRAVVKWGRWRKRTGVILDAFTTTMRRQRLAYFVIKLDATQFAPSRTVRVERSAVKEMT